MALAIAWNAVTSSSRPVYAVPESEIVVQPFAIPDAWPRAFGVDTSPYCTAAIWGMVDPQTGTFYLYEEYLGHDSDPLVHAREIRKRGAWIPGVMDPSGNGRSQADGYGLIEIYRKEGLALQGAETLGQSALVEASRRMSPGQFKVFATLTNFLEQFRNYRRDADGNIMGGADQLQKATHSLLLGGISQMRRPPVKKEFPSFGRYTSPVCGDWMRY